MQGYWITLAFVLAVGVIAGGVGVTFLMKGCV